MSPDDGAALASVRLSDIESPFSLAERDSRLQSIDSLLEEYVFHSRMILERWGFSEALILGIGTLALILGAWDLGIGELASGGDYNRNSFEGFLHVSDFSLMLSLLSLIAWIGLLTSLWARFPLMRSRKNPDNSRSRVCRDLAHISGVLGELIFRVVSVTPFSVL